MYDTKKSNINTLFKDDIIKTKNAYQSNTNDISFSKDENNVPEATVLNTNIQDMIDRSINNLPMKKSRKIK